MPTLLEQAKDGKVRKIYPNFLVTNEIKELVMAFVNEEISMGAVERVMGFPKGRVYPFLVVVMKDIIRWN